MATKVRYEQMMPEVHRGRPMRTDPVRFASYAGPSYSHRSPRSGRDRAQTAEPVAHRHCSVGIGYHRYT